MLILEIRLMMNTK